VIDAIEWRNEGPKPPEHGALRCRILLVERNAIEQRFVSGMLASLGFCVDVVVDGAEAVKAAARGNYATILMGNEIPITEGCDAPTELRRLLGESLRTPIIGISAVPTRSDLDGSLAWAVDDHIQAGDPGAVATRWTSD
jgi:CheY-like chemotaxis protein